MNDYFYGWYFRCQGQEGSAAVIPAVHLSDGKGSCSIQIINREGSLYREFPISQFRINRAKGIMQIGDSLFSRKGIRLRLEAYETETARGESSTGKSDENKVTVRGALVFGDFAEPKYDIMGPFACIPEMECRHAVYSMKHTVNGELRIGREKIHFQNGMGYMEGDRGTSFPEQYIWTQHFIPGGSIMLAAAAIPLARTSFTGTVGFLFRGNREYRFATYLGASVTKMGDRELQIRQGRYRLQVRFPENGGNILNAPDKGKMTRKVREDVACKAEYRLTYGKQILLHVVTDKAAAEYDAVLQITRRAF